MSMSSNNELLNERLQVYKNTKIDVNKINKLKKTDKPLGQGRYGVVYKYTSNTVIKIITHKKYVSINEPIGGQVEMKFLKFIRDKFLLQGVNLGVICLYNLTTTQDQDYLLFEQVDTNLWQFIRNIFPKSKLKDINEYKYIILQVIFTLAFLQKYIKQFRHNDLKIDNILVRKASPCAKKLRSKNSVWLVPKGYPEILIADFDYANCVAISNPKVKTTHSATFGCTDKYNPIYDLHLFLNSLYHSKRYLPDPVVKWIEKQVPKELLGTADLPNILCHGRLINPDNYLDQILKPEDLLNDSFFNDIKIK